MIANEAVELRPDPTPQMNFHKNENNTKLVGLSTYLSDPNPNIDIIYKQY
jgi:hypothetical protein